MMSKRSFNAPKQQSIRRSTRSRKPFLVGGGLVLGILAWFAPTIVVNSPLKNRIIASATGDFQGTISVGAISAGWLSKLTAKDVVAFDLQGDRLVEAASVQMDKNLIALLSDHANLGMIRVRQPIVNLVLRPQGSNLEDAIAPWLVPSDEPSNIGCEVEIEGGVVQVTDTTAGSQWTATKLNVGISLPNDPVAPLTLHVESQLNPPNGSTGGLLADLLWQRDAASLGKGNLSVKATAVPIELATPGLQRILPGATASGLLQGDLSFDWGETSSSAHITQLTAQNLHIFAPQWLGLDRIKLESLRASGEVTRRGGAWQVEQATIQSDLGNVTASGTASVTQHDGRSLTAAIIEALRHGQFQVDGKIDLARIAQLLPTTLKIREGTHVATGEITLALGTEIDTSGQRWNGRIEAKNLSAMHEGRHLTWEQPIVLTAAAHDLNGVIVFDKLACDSSFLDLVASGTSEQGAATLHGDFARLASELSQFVDLGEVRVAGRLDGKIDWQTDDARRVRFKATADAEQFELVSANRPKWREDRLTVQLTGVGAVSEKTGRAIDECELRVLSGQDQLTMSLLPTPAGTVRQAVWPVEMRLSGSLRSWMARLQPVFILPEWDMDGTIALNASANLAENQVQIDGAHAQLDGFRASNGSVFINEPVLKIDTKGVLDRAANAFSSPETTVASSSLALRATNIDVRMGEAVTQIAGAIDYRGDVGKLTSLLNDPSQPAVRRINGQATGHASLRQSGRITLCEWTGDIADFAYAVPVTQNGTPVTTAPPANPSRWDTVWQEQKLKLAVTVEYDGANSLVNISRMEAAGDTISFAARGKLSELATRCMTELDGQVAYDLQKLSARFRKQLGDDLQIAGRDTRPFSFRGPLLAVATPTGSVSDGLHPVSTTGTASRDVAPMESVLAQMIAQASLGWSSASVQGITLGAGEVDAKLADGRLVVAPMELAVSEGKLRLAPTVHLDRSPMVVTLPAGQVAERIQISPQMCTSWLKYLAPLVADATAAQGNFSVSLEQAEIPLDVPSASRLDGVLEIHTAQIGPGPLSQELLLLADQIKAIADGNILGAPTTPTERWLDLPSQRVAFRMAENRVYHQGLRMEVKDVVIRTSGSVGTDQTISLVAEVPIRDEWVARSKYLATLRGETIQIPIRGTLTSPKLDQNALRQITQQAATGAANRYIEGELNKQLNRGLEKLFGPPR